MQVLHSIRLPVSCYDLICWKSVGWLHCTLNLDVLLQSLIFGFKPPVFPRYYRTQLVFKECKSALQLVI